MNTDKKMSTDKKYKLYPRLDDIDYDRAITDVEAVLRTGTYKYNPDEADLQWLPLGDKVSIKELADLRERIMSLVKERGLTTNSKKTEWTKFDRVLGEKLLEWMPISPSIAADNGMWAYLNICLVPDLIKLRWSYDEYGLPQSIGREHYYSSQESYLKRQWFGAYLLDDKELHTTINRDVFDSLMGRTFTRGYTDYMVACVRCFRRCMDSLPPETRLADDKQTRFREYIKAVSKRFAYISWFALTEEQQEAVLKDCFSQAVLGVAKQEVG